MKGLISKKKLCCNTSEEVKDIKCKVLQMNPLEIRKIRAPDGIQTHDPP